MTKSTTLPNGVRVVLEPIPTVRSVSFGVWAASGSRREQPEQNGSAHFIEHMLFKGTENRSARDIAEEMDAIGGQINAFTTKEYTCFHTRVLDKHLDKAVEILADMYLRSRFDGADMDRERNVILEEIAMYEDDPEDLCMERLDQNIWKGCSLGRPILGTPDTVRGLTRAGLLAYFNAYYAPEKTVLALAGNFEAEPVLEKLAATFGGWKRGDAPSEEPVPAVYQKANVRTQREVEQLHLCLGFPGLPRDHRLKYAMSVFNTLFGGGMSSRLFQNIREQRGMTYTIYSYTTSYTDAGLFAIYAALNPVQAEPVRDLIFREMAAVRQEGVSEGLLQKTKEQLLSAYVLSNESTSNRMTAAGGSILMRNRILDLDTVLAGVEAVTREDLAAVMDLVLQPEQMSVSLAGSAGALAQCINF